MELDGKDGTRDGGRHNVDRFFFDRFCGCDLSERSGCLDSSGAGNFLAELMRSIRVTC
jgi:hypothetical protein